MRKIPALCNYWQRNVRRVLRSSSFFPLVSAGSLIFFILCERANAAKCDRRVTRLPPIYNAAGRPTSKSTTRAWLLARGQSIRSVSRLLPRKLSAQSKRFGSQTVLQCIKEPAQSVTWHHDSWHCPALKSPWDLHKVAIEKKTSLGPLVGGGCFAQRKENS